MLDVAAALSVVDGVKFLLVPLEEELETGTVNVELLDAPAAVELYGVDPAVLVAFAAVAVAVAVPVALAEAGTGTAAVTEIEVVPLAGAVEAEIAAVVEAGADSVVVAAVDSVPVAAADSVPEAGADAEPVETPAAGTDAEDVQYSGIVVTVTVTVHSVSATIRIV